MHDLSVYVRDHFPLVSELSLEFSDNVYRCLLLSLLNTETYYSRSSQDCFVLESISYNIVKAISVNLFAHIFDR